MASALDLGQYFASHAIRTFGAARLDETSRDAHRVLAWLRRHPEAPEVVSTRDVRRGVRFDTSDKASAALGILADHGWVEKLPETPNQRRTSVRWRVSPHIREVRKRVTNATKPLEATPCVTSVTDSRVSDPDSLSDGDLARFAGPGPDDPTMSHAATEVKRVDGNDEGRGTGAELAGEPGRPAMECLADYDWLRPVPSEQRPGRPSEEWGVHSKIVGTA